MNREEIKKILPHREPMLLLDEVVEEDKVAKGRYQVRGDEFFLQGHFPDNPIVPGVIQCEILAQSACILLKNTIKEGMTPVFTGLDRVRFKQSIRPGDVIETRCEITRGKHPFYFGKGELFVEGRLCMTGEFSFGVIGE